MSYPATGSLLALYVEPDEMGLAQGALSGIRSLALGMGPLIFGAVFGWATAKDWIITHEECPRLPFAMAAILSAAALYVAYLLPDKERTVSEDDDEVDEDHTAVSTSKVGHKNNSHIDLHEGKNGTLIYYAFMHVDKIHHRLAIKRQPIMGFYKPENITSILHTVENECAE